MKDPHDLFDAHSHETKALGPKGRGKLITDLAAPRAYSWLKNPDGLTYLHEHKVGESPPGSFRVRAPDTKAARTTAARDPLWYARGLPDD